jgi:hypothetical protein
MSAPSKHPNTPDALGAHSLHRLVRKLVCSIIGHNSRWSPDDADDYCRRCGVELYPDPRKSPNYLFRRKDFGLCAYWPGNAELLGTAPLML